MRFDSDDGPSAIDKRPPRQRIVEGIQNVQTRLDNHIQKAKELTERITKQLEAAKQELVEYDELCSKAKFKEGEPVYHKDCGVCLIDSITFSLKDGIYCNVVARNGESFSFPQDELIEYNKATKVLYNTRKK